jgi:hypothetical protein
MLISPAPSTFLPHVERNADAKLTIQQQLGYFVDSDDAFVKRGD